MPTTHIWKGASKKFIFDPTQYQDGTAFAPGDTLVVSSGGPSAGPASDGTLGTFATGTYQFTIPGASAGLYTTNDALNGASAMAVTGPGTLEWLMFDQFVSAGAIQVGSAAAAGAVDISMSTIVPATFTNQGLITAQNGSLFRLQPFSHDGAFVNAAGGMVSIGSGSALASGSIFGYLQGGPGNLNTTNNGVIEVTGAAGRSAKADFSGSYAGSGLLSVRGAPGASAANAVAEIAGPASGVFDVASGQLFFHTTLVSGGVNFLDNNAAVIIDRGVVTSYNAPDLPFGATILGFQAGDVIKLNGLANYSSFTYDPAIPARTCSPFQAPAARSRRSSSSPAPTRRAISRSCPWASTATKA